MADQDTDAKVLPFTGKQSGKGRPNGLRPAERKWGKRVIGLGYSILPSLLFRAQRRLGVSAIQLAIIVQIADYWWDHERKPYPSKAELAARLNIHPRNVQRHIAALEKRGLLKRENRYWSKGGQTSNAYDLWGIVEKLKKLEPEFTKAAEESRAQRRKLERPRTQKA